MEGNRKCLVKEISQYIYDGFEVFRANGTFESLVDTVDRNLHHIVYMRENGLIVGVAIFLMLTDSTFKKLIDGKINLKDREVFKALEKEDGRNIHVFTIRADRMRLILQGMRDVFDKIKPATISWFKDNELKNLRILKRRERCLKQ